VSSVRKREKPELAKRQVERKATDGAVLGTVDLAPEWFGLQPNVALMHQVVVAQLAAARSGTQSTLTRSEVRGGGAKPFRQKGMGRSRQGSIRAPQWVGGGVAFGPKPRSYKQRTPKKMIRLALLSALSDRAQLGRVALLDQWTFDIPKTKEAVSLISAFGMSGRILVVLGPDDVVAERSFGNLQRVHTMQVSELNAYDVLKSEWVLFTDESLPGGVGDVSSHKRPEPVAAEKAPDAVKTTATKSATATKAAATKKAQDVEADDSTDEPDGESEDATDSVDDEVTAGSASDEVTADSVGDEVAGSSETEATDDTEDEDQA